MNFADTHLDQLAKDYPRLNFSQQNLAKIRRNIKRVEVLSNPVEMGVRRTEHVINHTTNKALRLVEYTAVNSRPKRNGLLLHFHGGGFIMGRPESVEQKSLAIARQKLVTVVSVAYRLAPEHPYPCALDDAWAALKWCVEHFAVQPQHVIVCGESAGGGLAATLALYAKKRNLHVGGQLLTYPMLDPSTTQQPSTVAEHVIWTAENNRFAWQAYLGNPFNQQALVPAWQDNLEGLARTWIGVGDKDLFFAENEHFAVRLQQAGVEVLFKEYKNAFHAFDMAVESPVSRLYRHDYKQAIDWLLPAT